MIDLTKAKRVQANALATATSPVKEENLPPNQPKNASGWFLRIMLKYYLVASVASYVFGALVSGDWGIRPEFLFAHSIAAPILVLLVGCVEAAGAERERCSRYWLLTAALEFCLGGAASVLQFAVQGVPDLWIGVQIGFMFGALTSGGWLIKKVFW